MNNVKMEANSNNMAIRIFKGLLFSLVITLVSIFIFSIVLTYSNISESTIPIVIVVLTFISIFKIGRAHV